MMAQNLMLQDLIKARACPRETAIFVKHFGEGNEATIDRVNSVALEFDWPYAAKILLTKRQQDHFKALVIAAFRGIRRGPPDKDQVRRRKAMAEAFYKAFNGPKE